MRFWRPTQALMRHAHCPRQKPTGRTRRLHPRPSPCSVPVELHASRYLPLSSTFSTGVHWWRMSECTIATASHELGRRSLSRCAGLRGCSSGAIKGCCFCCSFQFQHFRCPSGDLLKTIVFRRVHHDVPFFWIGIHCPLRPTFCSELHHF